MRVLIIGSSGFLGSHLLELLREQNLQVDCCNRQGFKDNSNAASDNGRHRAAPTNALCELPVGAALCRPQIAKEIQHKKRHSFSSDALEKIEPIYDVVFLVAAHIPYGNLNDQSKLLEKSNVKLVQRVVKHFDSSRIVFCSSVSVYGDPKTSPIDEDYPLAATFAYAKSKLLGEEIVKAHPSYAILRFPSLYGPKMTATTFLPMIVRDALTKHEITLYGSGKRMQNYLYVKDAAKMLLLAAKSEENFIANAVFPNSYSNQDLAELVASIVGSVEINYTAQDDSSSFCYNLDKWQRLFDYLPETTLNQGISLLIEDVKQQLNI